MSESSGIIINVTGLQDVVQYNVVAFDAANNKYVLAQPLWTTSNNTILPAESAYIAGMVYTDPDSGSGQLLITGVIDAAALGIDNVPGDYYLGPNGTLVAGVPASTLPVYCGYCNADGQFIFRPTSPTVDGHRHTQYTLSGGSWSSAQSGGHTYYTYDDTNDTVCTELLASYPITSILVVYNGTFIGNPTLNAYGRLQIQGDTAPTSVTLFCTSPIATVNPEITAITPANGNEILQLSRAFGTVYVDTTYPIQSTTPTGTCVTGISREGVSTASVVHSLTPSTGIDITGENGVLTISNSFYSPYIDAQTLNANNVLIGSGEANDPLITFPAGIASSIVCIARLPHRQSGTWSFQVFVWETGGGASLSGTSMRIITPATPGSALGTSSTSTFSIPAASGGSSNIFECMTNATAFTAGSDALVTFKLSCNNPANAVAIHAVGLKLVQS